jgi:hypothetical protein
LNNCRALLKNNWKTGSIGHEQFFLQSKYAGAV